MCVVYCVVMFYMWCIFECFIDDMVNVLFVCYCELGRFVIEIDNGWYDVEIFGGEIVCDGWFEFVFEFVLKKINVLGNVLYVDIYYCFVIDVSLDLVM